MPLDDPLVQAICRAWEGVAHVGQLLERLKRRTPQHYRPLAKQTKTSGLAERDLPWAEQHRRAAAEIDAAAKRPKTPRD